MTDEPRSDNPSEGGQVPGPPNVPQPPPPPSGPPSQPVGFPAGVPQQPLPSGPPSQPVGFPAGVPQQPLPVPQPPGFQGQPGYGAASPYGTAPYPGVRQNAPSAVLALVLGLIAILVCSPVGIAAIIYGNKTKREIADSAGAYDGAGMGTAGVVLGWISIALMIITIIVVIILITAGATTVKVYN